MKKYKGMVAMIPARMGSQRLRMKNLALLSGKPLIYYAVQAARRARVFDRIVINSEDALFKRIAKKYGVSFYKRPPGLASSQVKSDSVVYDFMKNNPCDIVAWVNSVSPLQTHEEIVGVADYFISNKLDSLITVKKEQVHCIYRDKPVNFRANEMFSRTQDLVPVHPFVYSVMMWRTDVFMRTFKRKGHAAFCGKFGVYPVSREASVIIKTKEDFMMADMLLKMRAKSGGYKIKYDRVI